MIPGKIFFVKGVGVHKDQLASFERALRDAGIEKFNLVYVSSIFPPKAKIVPKDEGLKYLSPGEVVYCVMAKEQTQEPNRLICSAIGLALPKDVEAYGYLSEHHGYGYTDEKGGEYAEDLAATMLATTLGIEFDPEKDWQEREQEYKASGKIFKTTHISQSAEGNKNGLWTTVISAAVLVPQNAEKVCWSATAQQATNGNAQTTNATNQTAAQTTQQLGQQTAPTTQTNGNASNTEQTSNSNTSNPTA
jgi:arginine decarboxylase